METALKGQDNEAGNIRGGRIDGKFCFHFLTISCLRANRRLNATRRGFDSLLFSPRTDRLSRGTMRSMDDSGECLRDVWTRVSITS